MLDLDERKVDWREIILEIKHMENKEDKNESENGGLENNEGSKSEKSVAKYIDLRIIVLFAIGILFGFVVKTQTTKTNVIGANDPQLEKTRGEYLFTQLENTNEEDEMVQDDSELIEDESEVDSIEETKAEQR